MGKIFSKTIKVNIGNSSVWVDIDCESRGYCIDTHIALTDIDGNSVYTILEESTASSSDYHECMTEIEYWEEHVKGLLVQRLLEFLQRKG